MSEQRDADVQWRKAHEHATSLPSPDFPYESKYVEVNGHKMHYVESGQPDGDPIVFIHGAPTSVYLWRNVMPYVEDLGRCILDEDLPPGPINDLAVLNATATTLTLGFTAVGDDGFQTEGTAERYAIRIQAVSPGAEETVLAIQRAPGAMPIWLLPPSSPTIVPIVCVP